jgi:hypothetical protein
VPVPTPKTVTHSSGNSGTTPKTAT